MVCYTFLKTEQLEICEKHLVERVVWDFFLGQMKILVCYAGLLNLDVPK